jgi:hypothetical protein
MTWLSVLANLNAISNEAAHFAQVVAVIAAGAWAYWKYVRGRTFGARADLTISATLWSSVADPTHAGLAVSASLRNTGLSRITLAYDKKTVMVDWVPHERWMLSENELYWGPRAGIRQAVIFGDHDMVDAGEMIADEVVIPVPSPWLSDKPLAYRVRAYVTRDHSWPVTQMKRKQYSWVAHAIVPGGLDPAQDTKQCDQEG